MEIKLNNKVAIVTAASDGIGLVTALTLAQSGSRVYIAARNEQKVNDIIKTHPELDLHFVEFNADKPQTFRTFVNEVYQKEKRIDILVNNYGPNIFENDLTIMDTDYNFYKEIVDKNTESAYVATQEVLKYMKQQNSGSIINISSITSVVPDVMWIAYNSAKAMLNVITQNTASVAGQFNVRCNAILPGVVWSDDLEEFASKEFLEAALNQTPLNKFTTRQDVANSVLFLASDLSQTITGQLLELAGGYGKVTPLYSQFKNM